MKKIHKRDYLQTHQILILREKIRNSSRLVIKNSKYQMDLFELRATY
jgi:hypothetical protein